MIRRAAHWTYWGMATVLYAAWETFTMLAFLLTVFALALVPFILLAWGITAIVGVVG